MMRAAFGPETNPKVLEVIMQAQAGTPLVTAWKNAGKPWGGRILLAGGGALLRTPDPPSPSMCYKQLGGLGTPP